MENAINALKQLSKKLEKMGKEMDEKAKNPETAIGRQNYYSGQVTAFYGAAAMALGAALDLMPKKVPEEECEECIRQCTSGYGPPHNASPRCNSNGRNHCSCGICF